MKLVGVLFDLDDATFPCALTIVTEEHPRREIHIWMTAIEIDFLLGELVAHRDRLGFPARFTTADVKARQQMARSELPGRGATN